LGEKGEPGLPAPPPLTGPPGKSGMNTNFQDIPKTHLTSPLQVCPDKRENLVSKKRFTIRIACSNDNI